MDRLTLARAGAWHRVYRLNYQGKRALHRFRVLWVSALILGCCGAAQFIAALSATEFAELFANDAAFASLKEVIIAVGSALLGAVAIGFSFVMFAMQVNVERMPSALFRKFSSDKPLLGLFALTFALAIAVPCLGLVADHQWSSFVIANALLGTLLTFVLLIASYRRALALINPIQQLKFVMRDANRAFRLWSKRAQRATPLLAKDLPPSSKVNPTHDLPRTAYFQNNPHWTDEAKRSLRYAVSFARRYAELGDYEVSESALSIVIKINVDYVVAKGKTFYSDNALFVHPLSTDGFLNETLELLRQSAQIALSRGDEQHLSQIFKAIAVLAIHYSQIDYSSEGVGPIHAQIAAAYLSDAILPVLPLNKPDLVMTGVRLLGDVALAIYGRSQVFVEAAGTVDKIKMLGIAGATNSQHYPVTQEVMRQFTKLSIATLQAKSGHRDYSGRDLDKAVTIVAKAFLQVPDFGRTTHGSYLAPYFSSTTFEGSFLTWLEQFANAICAAPKDSEDAKAALSNLEEWSDETYQNAKELLILAADKNSHFGFDIIHWISSVTHILIVTSQAPASSSHQRSELLKHASWLVATLTWIPNTKSATSWGELYRVHEVLFDLGLRAIANDLQNSEPKFFSDLVDQLLDWGLRETKFNTGWGTLERCIMACAVLALKAKESQLVGLKLTAKLAKISDADTDRLERAAEKVRQKAQRLYGSPYNTDKIERAIENEPHDEARDLLLDLANRLEPKA